MIATAAFEEIEVLTPPELGFTGLNAQAIFAPLEPKEYLVAEIIPRGELILLVAYAGTGKSWLAASLATSVACGEKWLSEFQAEKGGVTYLDYENGEHEVRRRFHKLCDAKEAIAAGIVIDLVSPPDVYLDTPEFVERFRRQAMCRDLIIIDTLRAGVLEADENDSRIRTRVLDPLGRIARETGCTVLVLAHTKKKSGSRNEDKREAARGSSAIVDAGDCLLVLERADDGYLRLSEAKRRSRKEGSALEISFDDTDAGGVRFEVREPQSRKGTRSDDKLAEAMAYLLETIVLHPGIGKRELRIRSMGKFGSELSDVALAALERVGQIENRRSASGCAYFSVGRDFAE
jgi:hypothetical protein